jgi:hypothetical protein
LSATGAFDIHVWRLPRAAFKHRAFDSSDTNRQHSQDRYAPSQEERTKKKERREKEDEEEAKKNNSPHQLLLEGLSKLTKWILWF